jgi:hypothetical protein
MMARNWKEPRLPKDRINELALGIHHGTIYTDHQLNNPEMTGMVFMPLLFMKEPERKKLLAHPPALIYAHMKDAFPRSVNGHPMFGAIGFVWKADLKLIAAKLDKLKLATKEALADADGK